jgi:hypothetical protein
LVTGKALIEDGFRAGPAFSQIIEAAEAAQLEGVFDTKEAGLEWVRQRWSPPDGHSTQAGAKED